MIMQLGKHVKHNTIAYLALFVALGGTSYASVTIPQHMRATATAKASITCGGRCPARTVLWAYVTPGAVGLCAGPCVVQTAVGGRGATVFKAGTGKYVVRFPGATLENCARFANITSAPGTASVEGYNSNNTDPTAIPVVTSDAKGELANNLSFVVLALCGGGANNIQLSPPAA